MGTNVFWGDAVFGAATVNGERLERVATVEVLATRKRVSCEYDNDGGECGGSGGSGDAAGAGLLCAGEPGGGRADGV